MPVEVRNVVAGKSRGGEPFDVVDPADFATAVGVAHSADAATVSEALDAAASAAPSWRELSLEKRTDLVREAVVAALGGTRRRAWRAR
jgi:delta 1-pyrroline-5-carboxylate dehydrogenase